MSLVIRYGHPMGQVDRLCRAFPVVVLSRHGVTVGSIPDPVSVSTAGTAKTFRRDAINCLLTCRGASRDFPIKASEPFDDVHHAVLGNQTEESASNGGNLPGPAVRRVPFA